MAGRVARAVAGALGAVALLAAAGARGGGAIAAETGTAALVDAVVGEVEGAAVTASDVALARALGLFDLPPASPGGAVEPAQVERLVAVRLGLAEARALGMDASPEEVAASWRRVEMRAGGPGALAAWLAARGIDEAWARRAVEEDATWRRFVDERFRAFAFVSPDDVEAALGPGPHAPAAEEAARERLREADTARARDAWLAERQLQARLRILLGPGRQMPLPFE